MLLLIIGDYNQELAFEWSLAGLSSRLFIIYGTLVMLAYLVFYLHLAQQVGWSFGTIIAVAIAAIISIITLIINGWRTK